MASVQLPEKVRQVLSLLATSDDQTNLDNFLSVFLLVVATGWITPIVSSIMPGVGYMGTPVAAGALAVVVRTLMARK